MQPTEWSRAMVDPAAFVRANARPQTVPLLPEITLLLAAEALPLWEHAREVLLGDDVPPPYWAFAWVGGQAVARHVLDFPEIVRGKRVLDFAAGSGVVGIAAALAGAARVVSADIDAVACAAIALNAVENGVTIEVSRDDWVGRGELPFDVVLAGDVCYERPMAGAVEAWLRAVACGERLVLLGDPGRTYLPERGLERLASYQVVTTRELEDRPVRETAVYRVLPDGV